jgi:ferredoxin
LDIYDNIYPELPGETINMRKFPIPLPEINPSRCTRCGICTAVCPMEVMGDPQVFPQLKAPERCTFCAKCEDACPEGAISVPFMIGWADQP